MNSSGQKLAEFLDDYSSSLGSLDFKLTDPVLLMGMHKGGSTMLHNYIRRYCNLLNLKSQFSGKELYASLPEKLFAAGFSDAMFDGSAKVVEIIKTFPAIHLGWRQVPLAFLRHKYSLKGIKTIVLVRDPRDCVVSAYYSFLGRHVLPDIEGSMTSQIIQERRAFASSTIEHYCRENYKRFVGELARIAAFASPSLLIYRYEDIWPKRESFFKHIIEIIGLPLDSDAIHNCSQFIFVDPSADLSGHIRKGTPGDHIEKLSPPLVAELTSASRDLIGLFGYY
jgi:hypothetical protein